MRLMIVHMRIEMFFEMYDAVQCDARLAHIRHRFKDVDNSTFQIALYLAAIWQLSGRDLVLFGSRGHPTFFVPTANRCCSCRTVGRHCTLHPPAARRATAPKSDFCSTSRG